MIDSRHYISRILTALLLAMLAGAPVAHAQVATDTVRVQVLRVQGRGIYTSSDNVRWIRGDTLMVQAPDQTTSDVRVAGITSTTLLLTWLSGPIDVTVEDQLILWGPHRAQPAVVGNESPAAGSRESILQDGKKTSASAPRSTPIRVNGYYSLSVTGSMSTLRGRFTDNASSSRSFATPTSSLRLRVSELPGSLRFSMNARVSRSFSSRDISGRANTVRLYEFMVSGGGTGARLSYDLGRFHDVTMPAGGYWDGVTADVALGRQRVGFSIGYEPDRYTEAFATDILKSAASFELTAPHAGGASSLDGAVGMINSPWLDSPYSFLALGHRTRIRSFRLTTDLQLDRSPVDQSLALSRIQARLNLKLTERLGLSARMGSRKTFFYWIDGGNWSGRRDQQQVGLNWNHVHNRFGLTVGQNAYSGRESSWSVNATARSSQPWLPFVYTISSSMWSRSSTTTWYSSHSFQRDIGRVSAGLDYALMVLDGLGPVSLSHIAGLSARLSVGQKGYLSLRQRTHVGSSVLSSTVYLNFGVSF